MEREHTKILITGANGFIGTHLAKKFKDWHYTILDYKGDVTDFHFLRQFVIESQPTIIIHLAASVNSEKSYSQSKKVIDVNIIGTLNLLEVIKDMNIERFIHMGTEEVYGISRIPFKEADPIDPKTPYAISKATTEYFAKMYSSTYSLPVVLLRFAAVYGPMQNVSKLIPMSILSCMAGKEIALHSPEQKRDLIYIDDAVIAIEKACFAKNIIGEIINIGNYENYTIKEIVEKIVKIMQCSIPIVEKRSSVLSSDVPEFLCDITKAKNMLGWFPQVSIENGLKKTIEWYQKYGGK